MKIGVVAMLFAFVVLAALTLNSQRLLAKAWAREKEWQVMYEAMVAASRAMEAAKDRQIAALEQTIAIYRGGQ